MALFVIERNYAEAINPTAKDLKAIGEINAQVGVSGFTRFCPPTSVRPIVCMKLRARS